MLTETFVAATQNVKAQSSHLSSTFKDVGIYIHELQPQSTIRLGLKKSSVPQQCLAIGDTHIFAAQFEKAVVNVYGREKGNQEATVPFPQKITSLAYAQNAAILIAGTQDGKLILWEVATGRTSTSSAAHLETVSILELSHDRQAILSASSDSSIHVWSIANLVSFHQSKQSFSDSERFDSPIATFSRHRAGITALASGHSSFRTDFAVSTSEDKVCHVWHIDSCQLLRTVLLAEVPRCLCLDPADRAFYVGSEEGNVASYSLYDKNSATDSLLHTTDITPKTLFKAQNWKSTTADLGTALCLALSYDATILLTGHANGPIIRWDVGKRRVNSEVANLPQAVTNIKMLRPDELYTTRPSFDVPSVVKPRLDFATADVDGANIPVPDNYVFQAQITRPKQNTEHRNLATEFETAMLSDGIPTSLMDNAIQGMLRQRATGSATTNGVGSGNQTTARQVENLKDELANLKGELAALQKIEDQRYAKHIERMQKRDAIGLEKRKAYFAAVEAGRDGDAAMRPYAEKARLLDIESDEEAISERNRSSTSTGK